MSWGTCGVCGDTENVHALTSLTRVGDHVVLGLMCLKCREQARQTLRAEGHTNIRVPEGSD